MNSTERDSQDRSPAGCRYRIFVEVPSPDEDLYDEATAMFELMVTSVHLPRVGEELYFDAVDGLALTVSGVTHRFRHANGSPPETETCVTATVQQYTVTTAQQLLVDPEQLVQWAEKLPAVEVVPIPALVRSAAEYRQRHPQAIVELFLPR